MPIVTINKKTIHKYTGEELKDWIKYFNKHLANKAQNISANEEDDGVTINCGIPINRFGVEFIKDSLKFLERLADKKIEDEKRKSSKKKYQCQHCDYQVTQPTNLRKHIQSKHPKL